ncbi:hypothetical protein EMIHUDRAFT_465688 [Emiliania huxleyi CCMP1516]|uniref:Uncharacterized protein n=2 Tax=Emiliania huxleyi TaxID=2903 RepID=A0A0D3I9Q4_EMIH1|nr:hypothetical protein EMIHUDRAFT_465688 [Emiliania huxleyi CCMP1516]EOD07989.1 hypothetical protein EMIHUDRAFT_465688 [Emiliania huxleyi CCMP1516]|eukprot:XP_005760418.1 hypothetical protein EMIHUDRAFT_465688 [Emiliania huxleyi CCMP1516]
MATGAIHFARRVRGGAAAYAHTVPQAGAVRRWLPCADVATARCSYELHLALAEPPEGACPSPDARPRVVAFGSGTRVGPPPSWPPEWFGGGSSSSSSSAAAAVAPWAHWSWSLERQALASEVGFLVGHEAALQSCSHPTEAGVTLALGSLPAAREAAALGPEALAGRVRGRWPHLLYLSRSLPTMLAELRAFLLPPPPADLAAAREEPAAASAAQALANGALPALLRRKCTRVVQFFSGPQPYATLAESGGALRTPVGGLEARYTNSLMVLENDFYGVEAYGPIDLVVHYMDAPKRFTETVPDDVLALGGETFPMLASGGGYTCAQANLVADMVAWSVLSEADKFRFDETRT